jgi:hypothetical protein
VVYQDSLRNGVADLEAVTDFSVYPNPANSNAVVQFTLASSSKIKITISNTIGQTLGVITNESFGEGKQMVVINMKDLDLSSGIYFVNLENGGSRSVKKIVVDR